VRTPLTAALSSGGTLFLDEIGELPLDVQPKLLRVLEHRAIRRIGGGQPIPLDVRVMAATNRDLRQEVNSGGFRTDLYYRLNVVRILVPPLRERREDVPLLAAHFLATFAARGRGSASLTSPAVAALAGYDWPGNVRELENTLERLAVEARGGAIDVVDLPPAFRERKARMEEPLFAGLPSLEEMEKRYVRHVLAAVKGNRSRAAEVLGIDRRTLYRMAERFGIPLDDEATPPRE
jgi:DNA-binding NtrC family response regulator